MTSEGSSSSPLMTVVELAERIGVDVSTAYRYLRAGSLPGVQAGSSWLIDRARVERFLAGQEDAAGQPLMTTTSRGDVATLTVLPAVTASRANLAQEWLRGLHAALGLLLDAADSAATAEAAAHESHRQRAGGA